VPIVDLATHPVRVPLRAPFATAVRRTNTVEAVLVELRDEAGHSGWGEGTQTWRVTGDNRPGITAAVHGPLREVVLGRDPDDREALCHDIARAIIGNTAAKAAVDAAVHDLAARRANCPLSRLLGASTLRIPTDATLALGTTEAMASAAAARAGEGFTSLKVKLGEDTGDEVTRLRRIQDAAGHGVRLRVDANQAWSSKRAVRLIRHIEDACLGLELVEQPVPAGDVAGLAWVTGHVSTPILADESAWSPADLLELIRHRAADLVNIKLAKTGGLRPAKALAALAEAAGMGVLIGSMLNTHVGTAAAAALAAAIPTQAGIADLDAARWLTSSPVTGGIHYDGPTVVLPDAAGLGITGPAPQPRPDGPDPQNTPIRTETRSHP
jgi:L-alanine-DL-glutamate epimerase-like enolase superfamily enzyme